MIAASLVLAAPASAAPSPAVPDGCHVASGPSGPDLGLGFGVGVEGNPPAGWTEADSRPFDWDGDGHNDSLSFDRAASRATVHLASGSLTITGVSNPAAVADVTGDGRVDLIVTDHGEVRVLVGGQSSDVGTSTITFTDIGAGAAGWLSPPGADAVGTQVPHDDATIRPLWDIDGDGVNDFAVLSASRRSAGAIARYHGRACDGLATSQRRSSGQGTPRSTAPQPPPPVDPTTRGRPPIATLDMPDPMVMRTGLDYYLFTTNAYELTQFLNVPVRRSTRLWDWTPATDALPDVGSWSNSNHVDQVWAPAVHQFGATFVLYYTARVRPGLGADNLQCIGRATADTPEGPYVDNHAYPLVCQGVYGGDIDPAIFVDGSNTPWLLFKNDGNCCGLPTVMWSVQLSSNGQDVVGSPSQLASNDQPWEGPIVENPAMLNTNGVNWLFYSGNNWRTANYGMGYGWCWSVTGPCVKETPYNPWLTSASNAYLQGPGGGDFVQDPHGGWWLVHHGWIGGVGYSHGGTRALFIDKVVFDSGQPQFDSTTPLDTVLVDPPAVTGVTATQTGHNQVKARWTPVDHNTAIVDFYDITVAPHGGPATCLKRVLAKDVGAVGEVDTGCTADGNTYDIAVKAATNWVSGPPTTVPVTLIDYGTRFVGVTPARVLDTRDGTGRPGASTARVGPGETINLSLANRAGLPAAGQFSAVVLNLTVVNPSERSHLRAFPGDASDPPDASNLNFDAGATIAASTTVRAAPDGTVNIYNNSGSVHVVADIVGYYSVPGNESGALHRAVAPARVLDTRSGLGIGTPKRVGPQQSITLSLAGTGGLPAAGQYSSVIMNVTAVSGTSASHLRVYPGDQATPPFASSVNFVAGQNIANLVTVRAAADGTVKLYNQSGQVDIVADVVGYYGPLGGSAGAHFYTVDPFRIVDTRTFPSNSTSNPLPAGQPLGIGMNHPHLTALEAMSAAVLTVTVDAPSTSSHLTIWPRDLPLPTVSNLNFGPGQVIANQASVKVTDTDMGGGIHFYSLNAQNNEGTVQVIVDVNGWFGAEA